MSEHQQWEYNVADFKLSDGVDFIAERLNQGGVDGWEVVGTATDADFHLYVIRKRPKPNPPGMAFGF